METIPTEYGKVIGADGTLAGATHHWHGLKAGHVGHPVHTAGYSNPCIQVGGEFFGASCVIEGSLDGEHWQTLNDSSGVYAQLRRPSIVQIEQNPRYIRPRIEQNEEHGDARITVILYLVSAMR